jgi:hypothetical protein
LLNFKEKYHKSYILKIIQNNNIESNQKELVKGINIESFNRLYKGYSLNEKESIKLKSIKSPGLILLLSKEQILQIKEKIAKYFKNGQNKEKEFNIIEKIISKIYVIHEYSKQKDIDIEEDVLKN